LLLDDVPDSPWLERPPADDESLVPDVPLLDMPLPVRPYVEEPPYVELP